MKMNWERHISELRAGKAVKFRPKGNSMKGRIDSGDLVTVSPITGTESLVDKAVLCRVRGEYYVHLVKAEQGDMYLIGNNRGGTNGWTPKDKVYGVVTKVER